MSDYKLSKDTSILGAGADYLESLFEDVNVNSAEVENALEWNSFFDSVTDSTKSNRLNVPISTVRNQFVNITGKSVTQSHSGINPKQGRVSDLINSYRTRGHEWARTDPLGANGRRNIIELSLEGNGLSKDDLTQIFDGGSLFSNEKTTLEKIVARLEKIYCDNLGVEYMHIAGTTEKEWVRSRIESKYKSYGLSNERKTWLLQKITAAESMEKYLHTQYVGQKRFSLEGGESLIASVGAVIEQSGLSKLREIVIGMAHRGRLNILVNIFGKKPKDLFGEFEGKIDKDLLSGDVKYHQGFSTDLSFGEGHDVHMVLAFNPSHLEIVAPVVLGSVRARQDSNRGFDGSTILPIIIHGDAAFAGQGVVMETLNMSHSRGYTTHGTIHLVVNNQIGFTTSYAQDSRSTLYCTDVGKMLNLPIFHVNADNPEAVYFASKLAFEYRQTFKKDVIIDLVCYRRHGHNEADEPSVTQPVMYSKIKSLPTTCALYEKKLVDEGVITSPQVTQMRNEYYENLKKNNTVAEFISTVQGNPASKVNWKPYVDSKHTVDTKLETGVPLKKLKEFASKIATVPNDFEIHSRARNILKQRMEMASGEKLCDWGMAENLAYASVLEEGYPVRITGQDVRRGTFFHRHATYHNISERKTYTPLQKLKEKQPRFTIIDSLLSEEAVLAFEYGYSTTSPQSLVIWEGQFGDFANGAQVVIDQFITSGEAKWGRYSGLVMLLPHGYEGQGPEHSSARPERFLQLCADENIQLVVPTTPAQIFHLLCRQALIKQRKPLVVMTPKSLLRHPLAVSSLQELSKGAFENVIDDADVSDKSKIKEVVICSGKVYYDLKLKQNEEKLKHIAIIRLERHYPFPYLELLEVVNSYAKTVIYRWCQEEPKNQGAWRSIVYRINRVLDKVKVKNSEIIYIGRADSASPAVGSIKVHKSQQEDLVAEALGLKERAIADPRWKKFLVSAAKN